MTMSNSSFNELLEQLSSLSLEQLRHLNEEAVYHLKAKRAIENRRQRGSLEVGQRVLVSNGVKPQYLQGRRGTVLEVRSTRVLVKLDAGPVGKFRDGRVLFQPMSLTPLES